MAVSGARRFAARLVRRRDDSDPLVAWCRLPRDIRVTVAELARRGQPHPYPWVREIAVGWATAVCAKPFLWAWVRDVMFLYVMAGAASGAGLALLLHVNPLPYPLGWVTGGTVGGTARLIFVRARARRVLMAGAVE